jgi:hypothetical protein
MGIAELEPRQVVWSLSYTTLREPTWERGREVKEAGGQGGEGKRLGGGESFQGSWKLCHYSSLRPLYMVGRGEALPLHQGT